MNRCKICGQVCGIYEICRLCQKDIEEGKVKFCPVCNKYFLAGSAHDCNTASENSQEHVCEIPPKELYQEYTSYETKEDQQQESTEVEQEQEEKKQETQRNTVSTEAHQEDTSEHPRRLKKQTLIIVLSAVLLAVTIALVSVISEYPNWYGTEIGTEANRNDAITIRSSVYKGQLTIIVTPEVDIKNLSYTIYFGNNSKAMPHSEEFAQANKSITHKFSISQIETEYLQGNKYSNFKITNINGKIQNKYKDVTIVPNYNDQFDFKFEITDIQKGAYSNGMPYVYHTLRVACRITNNTDKRILSIQNCKMEIVLQDNTRTEIFLERLDFATPLEPGETQIIVLEDYEGFDLKIDEKIKEDLFREYGIITSYEHHNEIYSYIYSNKKASNGTTTKIPVNADPVN